jgi:uncharacterized membrane protein
MEIWGFSGYALWLIAGMTVITYAFRLGGLLLGDRLPDDGLAAYLLARIPGLVLVAVFLPEAVRLGWPGWLAGSLSALIAWRSGSMVAALLVSVGLVALARYFGVMPTPLF